MCKDCEHPEDHDIDDSTAEADQAELDKKRKGN